MAINETGRLVRDDGGFALERDLGGRWRLILNRVPVDHVEKRVRVIGWYLGEDMVEAEGVGPA